MVSGGYDCSLRFYRYDGEDWVTQQAIADAHADTIWSGAFDSSGNYFVSVGADRTVKIWQRIPGDSISLSTWKKAIEHTVADTRWPLYSVAWNSFGNTIATGGGDKKIRCLCNCFQFAECTISDSSISTLTTAHWCSLEVRSWRTKPTGCPGIPSALTYWLSLAKTVPPSYLKSLCRDC